MPVGNASSVFQVIVGNRMVFQAIEKSLWEAFIGLLPTGFAHERQLRQALTHIT